MHKLALASALAILYAASLPTMAGDLVETQKEKAFGEATEEHALIYFVRPAFMGKAVKLWAFADAMPLGATKGKTYTFGLVPEGKHILWSKAENVSALEMEVKGGETYYLKQAVRMGGMKARVKLIEMTKEQGEEALNKCKYAKLTRKGEERAVEMAEEYLERAREKARSDQ